MNDLIQELEETAAWLDGRAEILDQLAAKVRKANQHEATAEAARFRGRAALLRQVVINAKVGAK
ncbi:hypothetical protein GobsT_71120 [Gemmata obscuriglobus]|uniref:Uncharacterized protein n=1 Tax=Gemmata obscuriglobus TaxID=114 RepID=A0A2Z3HA69_9BACT|nr:hypothetical protein [Gemmata obscuriglobus]AWM41781.1 hypothetical protein C1280_35490 [Gemmata obscuriglobus]QEG32259.1 hypothetical protein GobsT_71120 [Gemmata obscuriglobus]VTS11615.1 unnamed protein product [Gemmata obscuriglobus UQM 2246]